MTGPNEPYPGNNPDQPYGKQPEYGQPPQYGQQPPYGQQPQYGGQQPYTGAPQYGSPPVSPKNGLGIAALIIGILSILALWTFGFGILLGIIAIVLGIMGRSRAKKGVATNGGMSLTGIVLGLIGVIAGVLFLVVVVWAVNETGFVDYADCVSNAGSDDSAIAQCNDEFQNNIEDRFSVTVSPFPTP